MRGYYKHVHELVHFDIHYDCHNFVTIDIYAAFPPSQFDVIF